jgi:hypothetical protein
VNSYLVLAGLILIELNNVSLVLKMKTISLLEQTSERTTEKLKIQEKEEKRK